MVKTLRSRTALLAVVVASASLGVPSLAHAVDMCVNLACQAPKVNYGSLDLALDVAEGTAAPDRIYLGPGTYKPLLGGGFAAPLNPVEIIGSGADKTTVTAWDGASPVLALGNAGSAVSNLAIAMPDTQDFLPRTGLSIKGGTASNVTITAHPSASSNSVGAALYGGLLEDSTVSVPSPGGTGVYAATDARVHNVDVTGGLGVAIYGADVQVDRARITSGIRGITATHLNAVVTNTLIHPLANSTGILAGDSGQSDVTLTVRNVTIVGDGGTSKGIDAVATVGHNITTIVDSSVIRGVQLAFSRSANPGLTNIGVMYSDFDPFATYSNGPGILGKGAGNIDADPLFTGTSDFHPLAGSPLVDAGNPATFNQALDLDGNARVVGTTRDIGAYELPAPAPSGDPAGPPPAGSAGPAPDAAAVVAKDTLAPVITGLKIKPARFTARKGGRIGFKLSEGATVMVTVKRRAAHGSPLTKVATLRRVEPSGAAVISIRRRIGHARLRPGRYVAQVTAVDGAGNRSRGYRLAFQVLG